MEEAKFLKGKKVFSNGCGTNGCGTYHQWTPIAIKVSSSQGRKGGKVQTLLILLEQHSNRMTGIYTATFKLSLLQLHCTAPSYHTVLICGVVGVGSFCFQWVELHTKTILQFNGKMQHAALPDRQKERKLFPAVAQSKAELKTTSKWAWWLETYQ